MSNHLRCIMTDVAHAGLPGETRTPCNAPAVRWYHVDITGTVPCMETVTVCERHYVQRYLCHWCGGAKGSWRGSFCQACLDVIEKHPG